MLAAELPVVPAGIVALVFAILAIDWILGRGRRWRRLGTAHPCDRLDKGPPA